jgi:predicted transcriptional regulator
MLPGHAVGSRFEMQMLLMSIRPRFADQILRGVKRFELRRRPLRVQPGAVVVVYASASIRAVIGAFVVDGILTKSVPTLWDELSGQLGVTKDEYDSYFAGTQVGHASVAGRRQISAIVLSQVSAYPRPVSRKDAEHLVGPGLRVPPSHVTLAAESPWARLASLAVQP